MLKEYALTSVWRLHSSAAYAVPSFTSKDYVLVCLM
nr:MAG TPA: hypothetical protein [Caudoviricetes sp.]